MSWHDSHCVVQSDVVRINLNHGTTEMRLPSVGVHAHGLVLWHDKLILLDSEGSALVAIHPPSSTPDIIWRVSPAEAQRARIPSRWRETVLGRLNIGLTMHVRTASCPELLSLKPPAASILAYELVSSLSEVDFISCM